MEIKRKSVEEIKRSIVEKLQRNFASDTTDATEEQLYQAVAWVVRDEIMERRAQSRGERKRQEAKKLYYLSAEFLVGRALHNNMVSLVNEEAYTQALNELEIERSNLFEVENDPGLGNGGLGRLASCFLDSLATLKLPAMGMTIRYEFGLFRQKIVDGFQVEMPDNWLSQENIWEICRPSEACEVKFGGWVEEYQDNGKARYRHVGASTVQAVPYDMPVVGYDSNMVNMLRTWSARAVNNIDMSKFSRGQYSQAVEEKELAEVISKVLYPEDNHSQGKELRLKQQYFLSSASMQYIVKDFEKTYGPRWEIFPDKVAVQINDTHPGMAIPELMRILIDEKDLSWEEAEKITRRTFNYTNHTVMQEALETWSEELVKKLLPRIYMILQEINKRVCQELWNYYAGQWERIGHMAVIAYGRVYMANLCVSMSNMVNGVSQIHAGILRRQIFQDYCNIDPTKFIGITNGITHRRWLMQSNPGLSSLLDSAIGDGWRKDPEKLIDLLPFADDAGFRNEFGKVKYQNKVRLANFVKERQGAIVTPDTLFDVQVKRLHEYKRQLMNALGVLILYNRICDNPNYDMPDVTVVFGAKASPGYTRAKLIIKLIGEISNLVKRHPVASKKLNVVFLENYCVSAAEVLIPASDISEQISTAGKEASGTGNMKFMMNGAVTLGTLDGANVEIVERVGMENAYIFGKTAEEVDAGYSSYRSSEMYQTHWEIRRAMEQLIDGTLCPESPRAFMDLYRALLFSDSGMADPYFVLADLTPYMIARENAYRDYRDRDKWLAMAIRNVAQSGFFASDRTIAEYNDRIWRLKPLSL